MNRILSYALIASAALGGTLYAALGQAGPPVVLQATTPGTQQLGNANVSGKVIAGGFSATNSNPTAQVFVGNATSTTGANYGGLFRTDSSTGTGIRGVASATTGAANGGTFQSGSPNGAGVRGNATATTGVNYGVYGKAVSPGGFGVYGLASAISGGNAGGFFQSNSEEGSGVVGIATSTIGSTAGVFGQSASVEGYGVRGRATNPAGYGVYSDGNMHATGVISGNGSGLTNLSAAMLSGLLTLIGTSSSHIVSGQNSSTVNGASGVYGLASGASGQTYGVQGTSGSPNGFGVFGAAPATSGPNFGGRFESASSSGTGVFGEAKSATGINYGVFGKAISPFAIGVYGSGGEAGVKGLGNIGVQGIGSTGLYGIGTFRGIVAEADGSALTYGGYFQSSSSFTNSAGVFGIASAATGITLGVCGQSNSTEGYGVIGVNDNSTGNTFGVYGRSASQSGYAIYGINTMTEFGGVAVFGTAGGNNGAGYGVYGRLTGPQGYGVYAQGPLGASGTKSFRIDHPHDPENKYLLHYSTESPTPQNFYVGNVVTDAKGYGWVELPDYFEDINTNFKYQLTVVDGKNTDEFVMAKVALKIKDGRFLIRTSSPRVEVSWRVDADRNDLWIQRNPPKDVADKKGREKGTYQHPELYGFGPERGMNYSPDPDKPRKAPPVTAKANPGRAR